MTKQERVQFHEVAKELHEGMQFNPVLVGISIDDIFAILDRIVDWLRNCRNPQSQEDVFAILNEGRRRVDARFKRICRSQGWRTDAEHEAIKEHLIAYGTTRPNKTSSLVIDLE